MFVHRGLRAARKCSFGDGVSDEIGGPQKGGRDDIQLLFTDIGILEGFAHS